MPTNQIARVADGTPGINTLSAIRRIPIIFVPGIMGSRLTDPETDELVWNPMGFPAGHSPRSTKCNHDRLADVSRPLAPDTTHPGGPDAGEQTMRWETAAASAGIANFTHLIPDFDADTVIQISQRLKSSLSSVHLEPKIYCCGYDWRVDNAVSANALADVVNKAMSDCDGEKAILVAHSMGGLVCRYFCKNLGGEAKVRAQFLLASPTNGAVDSYVTLKTGATAGLLLIGLRFIADGAWALAKAALWTMMGGPTNGTFPLPVLPNARAYMRQIPSVWQLLPTTCFSQSCPTWVTFDPSNTGWGQVAGNPDVPISAMKLSDANNLALLYLDMYTGFTDLPDVASRTQGQQMVAQALAFHATLNTGNGMANDPNLSTYMHPVTYAVFCSDNPGTPVAAAVSFDSRTVDPATGDAVVYSSLQATYGPGGDMTVPTASATPSLTTMPIQHTKAIAGTEHQKLPSNSDTIDYVISNIAKLLGAA